MRSKSVHFGNAALLVSAMSVSTIAQVFTSEFFIDPVSEGWILAAQYCTPVTWDNQGWYYQQLDNVACPQTPEGAADVYRRSLVPFNGVISLFAEFRVLTNGDRSMIPFGAPALLAMGNNAGVTYHLTVANDLVKFLRDVDLPIWFIEIDRGVPHTYRLEIQPDRYSFFVDADLIDEGLCEGPFPAYESSISWRGRSWYLPCENAWDYIRYGVIPEDGSGDFDSDGAVTQDDFYFFHECLTNNRPGIHGGPDQGSGPGCRFADFDADSDTDLQDLAAFQNAFGQLP